MVAQQGLLGFLAPDIPLNPGAASRRPGFLFRNDRKVGRAVIFGLVS